MGPNELANDIAKRRSALGSDPAQMVTLPGELELTERYLRQLAVIKSHNRNLAERVREALEQVRGISTQVESGAFEELEAIADELDGAK